MTLEPYMSRGQPSVSVESPHDQWRGCVAVRLLACVLTALVLGLTATLSAQTAVTFRYFYDDAGQLTKVVDSTGVVLDYVYDPVGNILEIRRSTSPLGGLTVFNFTPGRGGPLTVVSVQGQGFASTLSGNIVRFNGVVAAILSATSTTLVVSVPVGATSGPVSVTVAGNTATSADSFMMSAVPVITSITPQAIDANHPPATVRITGGNLSGATYSFLPALLPPPVSVGTPQVNGQGTTAVLPITVSPNAHGRFVVVGTNNFGPGDAISSAANTISIVSGQGDTDSDGDGFPDVLEVLLGSDPLDANNVPNPNVQRSGEVRADVTVLNTAETQPVREAPTVPFSTLNISGYTGGTPVQLEAHSPQFSVLNIAQGSSLSGGEGTIGGGTPMPLEAHAVVFSVVNTAPSAPPGGGLADLVAFAPAVRESPAVPRVSSAEATSSISRGITSSAHGKSSQRRKQR